jgi:hypothetical protein
MPTRSFFDLPDERRERLVKEAIAEFAERSLCRDVAVARRAAVAYRQGELLPVRRGQARPLPLAHRRRGAALRRRLDARRRRRLARQAVDFIRGGLGTPQQRRKTT